MNKKKKLTLIILILSITTITLPVLIGCFYGMPSADDFSNSLGWMRYEGNHFKYILQFVHDLYTTWQGTYTGLVFCSFPMYYKYGLFGLRLTMIATFCLFIFSIILLVYTFTLSLDIPQKHVKLFELIIVFLVLSYLFFTNDLSEIFYWYTGIGVYTLPICFSLIAISLYLLFNINRLNIFLYLGILLSFLGSGGALNISAFLCSSLLLCLLHKLFVKKTIDKSILIGISALIGALINVAAPGNYARHNAIDTSFKPIWAIHTAIYRVTNLLSVEFKSGFLLTVIVCTFILGRKLLSNSSFNFKYPFLMTVYGFMAITITDFPVLLGYSTLEIPGRVAFVEHISIIVYIICTSLYWGGWCAHNNIFIFNQTSILILVLVCFIPLSTYFDLSLVETLTPFRMIIGITNGDYKNVVDEDLSIINQIINSESSNAVVYTNHNTEQLWTNIKRIELSEDSNYWVNYAVSQYFGKDSVTLIYY